MCQNKHVLRIAQNYIGQVKASIDIALTNVNYQNNSIYSYEAHVH